MNQTKKDTIDLYKSIIEDFKDKDFLQQILKATDKIIEIESRGLKADEKVVVDIDTDNPLGCSIRARKVKK
jgi:hypothetical protein|tara:strand:- start:300 stop:512 length:213 start_codon:yes stop_codon:yes gene_type:complete